MTYDTNDLLSLVTYFLFVSKTLYHVAQIGSNKLDTDGKEDDTKELAQDGDNSATKEAFQPINIAKHQIVNDNIEQQGNKDIDIGIFSP